MDLADLVADGGVVVLSGAGLSTDSGIPDYRGETGRARAATPMTYQVFSGSEQARRRYWARSYVGWPRFSRAVPNAGHRAIADLERAGLVRGVITQNVDGLHGAAGTSGVVELHGALRRVACLRCGRRSRRDDLQAQLAQANPGFRADHLATLPDGDAALEDVERFVVVDCAECGGALKPDVVFFGEQVPGERVSASLDLVGSARCLLVLGSSLAVMSGYRFVLHAARRGVPVAIVNLGTTRGDAHATVKVEAPLGEVLPGLVSRVAWGQPPPAGAVPTTGAPGARMLRWQTTTRT